MALKLDSHNVAAMSKDEAKRFAALHVSSRKVVRCQHAEDTASALRGEMHPREFRETYGHLPKALYGRMKRQREARLARLLAA